MRVRKAHVKSFLVSFLWVVIAGCAGTLPELKTPLLPSEELVILGTRPGVTVRVLIKTPNSLPKGTFLYFPGGDGSLVNTQGRGKWLYSHVFPEHGFITAMVDVPSDRPYGMTGGDRFRRSKEHTEDVKKIVDFANQRWPHPIYLIGHSAGATSVGYLATVLQDHRIRGAVVTGVVGEESFATLPLHNITYPTLFVHHREDPCVSFEAALRQHQRLINSPRLKFVEVLGGDRSREINCSPIDPSRGKSWAHGFSGKEREVAILITDWVSGKPVPDRIGP